MVDRWEQGTGASWSGRGEGIFFFPNVAQQAEPLNQDRSTVGFQSVIWNRLQAVFLDGVAGHAHPVVCSVQTGCFAFTAIIGELATAVENAARWQVDRSRNLAFEFYVSNRVRS